MARTGLPMRQPQSRTMRFLVDSRIRWDARALPRVVVEDVQRALTFPNRTKQIAKEQKVRGWQQMPDTVTLFDPRSLPRGFALQMRRILERHGIQIDWADRRVHVPVWTGGWKTVQLRDYQEQACDRIEAVQQGIWQSPPASGKTVTVLEAIRRCGQRAVVIVNTSNIARQWVERSEQFLGYTPGVVGDGDFEVSDITIALQQTLWARRDELDDKGFWSMFGFVCLDECHHLPAHTFRDTVQRFPAAWRIGVSGTPEMQQGTLPEMQAILGHRFHVTPKKTLVDAGVLAKPRVDVIVTAFDFDYVPTHEHRPGTNCEVHGCTASRHTRRHSNNYSAMMSALVEDPTRNEQIAIKVVESLKQGRTVIVVSKRLKHLDALAAACGAKGAKLEQLYRFSGGESTEQRMQIAEVAMKGGVALFSTLGDEALDIPRLDTVVLAYPTRNTKLIEQRVGRVERIHADKFEPLIIDVFDAEMGVLRRQFFERKRDVYDRDGLDVQGLPGLRAV